MFSRENTQQTQYWAILIFGRLRTKPLEEMFFSFFPSFLPSAIYLFSFILPQNWLPFPPRSLLTLSPRCVSLLSAPATGQGSIFPLLHSFLWDGLLTSHQPGLLSATSLVLLKQKFACTFGLNSNILSITLPSWSSSWTAPFLKICFCPAEKGNPCSHICHALSCLYIWVHTSLCQQFPSHLSVLQQSSSVS